MIDDVRSLPASIRFAVPFAVAGGFLWACRAFWPQSDVSQSSSAISLLSAVVCPPSAGFWLLASGILAFWIVGLLNIYNFMDGIDGIAGTQAMIAGAAWWLFGTMAPAPFVAVVGASVAAGALGFLTLNWPPAKIFMGDAGATVLGYFGCRASRWVFRFVEMGEEM